MYRLAKKSFLITLCFILFLFSSVSKASIPQSEMQLGGVNLKDSIAYIKSIYGEPKRTETKNMTIWGGRTQFYNYYFGNGSFSVCEHKSQGVLSILTNANNGIKTRAGITVGMSKDAMIRTYGNPDESFTNPDDGATIYVYNQRSNQRGTTDSLNFAVINDKISRIYLSAAILSI